MSRLIRELIRPYRGTIAVILLAMFVQTLMSLAGPWPLKIILDNVVGSHHLPHWMANFLEPLLSGIYPLSEAVQAFEAAGDRSKSMKVQLAF